MPRLSKQLVKDRESMVIAMLSDRPDLSNAAICDDMERKTGTRTTNKFVNHCRAQWEKSKRKFTDGKNRELKNGTMAKQTTGGVPQHRVENVEQEEGKKAFGEKQVSIEYVTGKKKGEVTYTLEEANEKAKPALRNLRTIIERTPDLIAYLVGRDSEGRIGVACNFFERTEKKDELTID